MEQQFFLLAANFNPRLHPAIISRISRQLAKILKQPISDISQILKYGMGLYAFSMPLNHINDVIATFKESNLPVQHLELHQVKNLGKAIAISKANILEDCLEIIAPKPQILYWSNILGISLGVIWPKGYEFPFSRNQNFELLGSVSSDEEARNALKDRMYREEEESTGITMRSFLAALQNREVEILCDFIAAGKPQVYRVSLEFFIFTNLEGKESSSLSNFCRFVAQIVKQVEGLRLSLSTEIFVDEFLEKWSMRSDLNTIWGTQSHFSCDLVFDSVVTYERYLRSLLTQWNLNLNDSES